MSKDIADKKDLPKVVILDRPDQCAHYQHPNSRPRTSTTFSMDEFSQPLDEKALDAAAARQGGYQPWHPPHASQQQQPNLPENLQVSHSIGWRNMAGRLLKLVANNDVLQPAKPEEKANLGGGIALGHPKC